MKKIFIVALAALLLVSCGSPASKLNSLADKLEKKGATMTQDQWEAAVNEFTEIVEDYYDNYSDFSKEERKDINKAIGRVTKAAATSGVEFATNAMNDVLDGIPDLINGAMEGVKGFLEGLGIE